MYLLSLWLAQKASFTAKINCQTPVAASFGAQCKDLSD